MYGFFTFRCRPMSKRLYFGAKRAVVFPAMKGRTRHRRRESKPMHEQLRVLILEDDPLDAELAGCELVKSGRTLEVETVADRKGFVQRWNRAFEAIAGKPGKEIVGRPCCGVLEVGHHAREDCVFHRMLKSGHRESLEFEMRDRWCRETVDPVFDRESEMISAVYVVSDITERRRIEQELAGERNLLKTLVDALPDTVYVKDLQSRFVAVNTAEARLVGAERTADLVGKTDFDYYPREYADQYYHDEQIILKTGNPLINKEEITGIVGIA